MPIDLVFSFSVPFIARLTKVGQLEMRLFSLTFVEILACLHGAVGGNKLAHPAIWSHPGSTEDQPLRTWPRCRSRALTWSPSWCWNASALGSLLFQLQPFKIKHFDKGDLRLTKNVEKPWRWYFFWSGRTWAQISLPGQLSPFLNNLSVCHWWNICSD